MKQINTEIEIRASARRVWETLTSFEAFPDWNPFLRKMVGEPKVDTILTIYVNIIGGIVLKMKTRVLSAEPGREFSFIGKLPGPSLLSGEHSWEIVNLDNGHVKLIQREIYRGLLVPIFFIPLERTLARGFEAMDIALKERVESSG